MNASARRYSAYLDQGDRHKACAIPASGFLEAAVTYAELWAAEAAHEGEIAVTVVDCDTGERCCFRIDLSSGTTEPC